MRSGNHCSGGKAISIAYCECVFVALGIGHAMRMRHIVACGLPLSRMFSTLSHERHYHRQKVTEMCIDFLYNVCLKHFCTLFV